MKNLSVNPRKPDEWGRDASKQHGWKEAYSIAKKYSGEYLGKEQTTKNPHQKYWAAVVVWIETNAPNGELKEDASG